MWREDDRHAQMRDDFRMVTVVENTVRLQAHLTETGGHAGLAARTADAAGRVDHRPLIKVQQLLVDQRFQRQLRRRRITARYGDQLSLFDFVALPFRQAIHRLLQQVGMLMFKTVILAVEGGIFHAERAGQVKHHATCGQKRRRDIVADLVCRRQEHYVDTSSGGGYVNQRLQGEIDDAF
ncbi:hypothetical protein D3C81_1682760 [compost metagenome]